MIAYNDFVPGMLEKRMLGLVRAYENLYEVVTRANRWIEAEGVRVINVETILLPMREEDDPTAQGHFPEVMGAPAMRQIVRVWYIAADSRSYTGETRRLDTGASS